MRNIRAQRRAVRLGIFAAWVVSAAFIAAGVLFQARTGAFFGTPARAAAFALSMAGLALVAGIGLAAAIRHFLGPIDGGGPAAGTRLDLTLRYVTNTTEQTLAFSLAGVACLFADESLAQRLLPVMGVWFVIARAAFFLGYRIRPVLRAFGFAATFHPTIALLAVVLARLLV
ncbi:hypothetical protein [uncultured Jannaschia sp.]|uniref:hypothetical protein n=1 Tax=uncultured Jannaschia sp. TaxID=293347 RepID=UPI0026278889|nr:hypothetical protein [uncultured Jannaschia sp.]